ncbi:uncharacterized protein Dvar_07130 [Desulfosarcina variabilis str. Montpellier]
MILSSIGRVTLAERTVSTFGNVEIPYIDNLLHNHYLSKSETIRLFNEKPKPVFSLIGVKRGLAGLLA